MLLTLVGADTGESISELKDAIISDLEADVRAAMQFRKLVHDALDGATETQLGEKFESVNLSAWDVRPDFPSLRRSDVPGAVQTVSYTIALPSQTLVVTTSEIGLMESELLDYKRELHFDIDITSDLEPFFQKLLFFYCRRAAPGCCRP